MTVRLFLSVLALASLPGLRAQTTNLRVSVSFNGTTVGAGEGSTIPVQSDGRDSNGVIFLTNGGPSAIVINQLNVSGADFTVTSVAPLPATLTPGASISAGVRYRPVSGRSSTAQVSIAYTEANQGRSLTFTLTGAAPDYAFALAAADGTRSSITPASRITFPPTRPGSSQTLTLIVLNRGSAPGMIRSVATTGTDYTATPIGNTAVAVGQEVSIPITFTPQGRGASTGSLSIDFGFAAATFTLDGIGAAPDYVIAYVLRSDGNTRPLANDGRLTFPPTPATTTAVAEVIVGNQGNGAGNLRGISFTGTGFSLAGLPLLPLRIEPGQAARFLVQFNPRQLGSFSGSLRIELDDRTVNATLEGTTSNPNFSLFYIDPVTRNTVAIAEGGALTFPATNVNANLLYTIVLRNQGDGTGFVRSISMAGDAFQLVDIPALPATIAPAGEIRFGLRFSPRQRQLQTGLLRIEFSEGALAVPLAGSGVGPDLAYEATGSDGAIAPLPAGSELTITTPVGQTGSKAIRIINTGNSEALIAAISVTGAGFGLSNVPFLPATIPISGSQMVNVTFTPTQPGTARGRLRIGDQDFDLTGTGIAPRLEFSYLNEAGTTQISGDQPVVLTSARVGETTTALFAVSNTGTSAIVISTIDLNSPNAVFAVENAPALPLSLEPGAAIRFGLRFAPNNTGAATGTLRVNNTAINVTGAGRQPVPLPDQQIEGPTGVQPPLQQPGVGLRLASPYSLPLRGSLSLSFVSNVFSENPAVQFATGGRTVNFTIPANSTRAIFENGATEVRLQTGTVAGTIQLAPTFTTQAGLDLTPQSPALASITIDRSAPRLLTAEISGRSTNSLVVLVTGYSTTRALRQVDLRLTPNGDQRFSTTAATLNIESASLVWFQSTTSQALGGLFSMTIPVTLQRGNSTENLLQYLRSLSVTVANEIGTSNNIDIALQ